MTARKPATRWIAAVAVLVLFVLLLVVLERTLAIDETSIWALRVGLIVLGLVAAGAVLWYLRPQEQEAALDPGDDVLLAIGAARARLPRSSFAARPLVLVLGPEGSAKTSLVARSGGDPELLAGEAPQSVTAVPSSTKTANVWVLQQAVLAELASSLLTDPVRFAKVVRALRAPRMAAAVGQGDAAPRAVVLCVPCDLFYAGGNGEHLQTLAQTMRLRLAEASRELGLALPVYVVFTKCDRVPHFEPWASVFTKDELRAPLGASLAFDAGATTANYAERLAPRLEAAYSALTEALGARRVGLLGREAQLERRYAAYELPRELRKLQAAATQFLVELCRPTQLGVSPLLRGFYFIGARPVLVRDVAAPPVAVAAPAATMADATQVFQRGAVAAAAAGSAAPVSRKIPEWVGLDRFLRDVVIADAGAASVARGGVRVQRTRRVLLSGAIAAAMLLLTAVTASWLGNRSLQARVSDAARAVAALPVVQSTPGAVTMPSEGGLAQLEQLRALLDTLQQNDTAGPPLWLRFGLWRGPALLAAARPVWMEGFRRQLFAETWSTLNDSLKALPDVPSASSDYMTTYGWLKSYVIITSVNDSSTATTLAPVLLSTWQRGVIADSTVVGLARRQFAYYADLLPSMNGIPQRVDAYTLQHTREFVLRFAGAEQIYLNMIAAADRSTPPVKIPQAPGLLTAAPEVTGAFSTAGHAFMQRAFSNIDDYTKRETWVVGTAPGAGVENNAALAATLRTRYQDDYVRRWTQVLRSATLARPPSLKEAAVALEQLSGVQSPLLQFLRTVAVHTAVDSVVQMAFQPVHAVTPPAVTDKFVSETNQEYVGGLGFLRTALASVPDKPVPTDTQAVEDYRRTAQMTLANAGMARQAEQKLVATFTLSATSGPTVGALDKLLQEPIVAAEGLLRDAMNLKVQAAKSVAAAPAPAPAAAPPPAAGGGGAAAAEATRLNERGRALCSRVEQLTARFPFNPAATLDASIADVKAILTPNEGELWVFQQEALAPYLEKQGNSWVAKPGGKVELSKSFVDFFNRAAEVSAALFAEDPTTPMVRWLASGVITERVPLLILRNNGKEARFDQKSFKNEVVWPATNGRDAQLQAQFRKNKPVSVRTGNGDWAIFRLVAAADVFEGQSVTWNATGKEAEPVTVKFEALRREAASVLTRGWLGRMSCVAQVTK